MLRAALRSGAAARRSVFEVFARHLPSGRRYGVVAGTGRLLDAIEQFRFGPDEIGFLRGSGVADDATLRYLESYRFGGDIWGYAEGDCYFPGSPILVVEGRHVKSRLISARETARLMGLPESYQLPSNYNEAYHLTGDGVAVPVVAYIAKYLFEPLLRGEAIAKAA